MRDVPHYRATARVEQMGDLEEEGGRYAARKVGVGWPSMVKCQRCRVVRWVCENHPDKPWDRDHERTCGGAGMPCPDCNEPREGERPAMSADFIPAFDQDKGPIH